MNRRLAHILKWQQDNAAVITKGKPLSQQTKAVVARKDAKPVQNAKLAMQFRITKRMRSELKEHFERQFSKGMTWENYGDLWEIDHVVPLATAKTVIDVLALNHFTNLRPRLVALNRIDGRVFLRRKPSRFIHLDCATVQG
jgi:hypothetical protein